MNPLDEAKSIVHVHSILYSGWCLMSQAGYKPVAAERPNRMLGTTTLARLFHMAPETMATAHKFPTSLESLRSGLLRVRVVEAQRLMFNRADWWTTQWIPSRENALTQAAWNHLYDRAQERNLLTYFRKKWYSQLSYDMERLPVLVVDLVARAVGYPCGLAVRDPGVTIYDKRAQLLSRAEPSVDVFDLVGKLPSVYKAYEHGRTDEYFLTHTSQT